MAKEVMNEEVKINEEATAVEVPVKESKIKKIWNTVKKPLAYAAGAAVVIGGIALTVVKIKGSGLDEVVEETTEE